MSTPDTLKNDVDNGTETINQPETNQNFQESIIPPQYDGLPSEVVEELWTNPIYLDEEKNQSEAKRRQNAIDQIKANENTREEQKRGQFTKQYSQLPDDDKNKFPGAQGDAVKITHEFIKGERELPGLSREEQFVLDKIKSAYEDFKKENPDKEFPFQLASDIDKQVWDNLNYRLAFDVLNSQKQIADQEEANKIREEIGIPTQNIKKDDITSPQEKTSELSIEEKSNLTGWEAGFELAKIAQKQRIDLSSISREEYVQLAIDNGLPIDDDQLRGATWQRNATSLTKLMDMRKERKGALEKSDEDKAFASFENTMKTITGKDDPKEKYLKNGIRVRSGTSESNSWLFFGINNGIKHDSTETYKSYISLTDIKQLSPEKIISFMEALRDAGYNGDIKTFQDLAGQGVVLNDQVVMHGRTEEDAKLALQTAEKFFGNALNQKGLGKDEVINGKNMSYSQILADKIKKEIKNSPK
jgi:hypothetical protein